MAQTPTGCSQRWCGPRAVKAFNTVQWELLRGAGRPPRDPECLAIPITSDDALAKALVAELVGDLCFDAFDNGTLAAAVKQQPHTPVHKNPVGATELQSLLGR